MNISIFLAHSKVPFWNFSHAQLQQIQQKLPDAKITVCSTSGEFQKELPNMQIACVWYFKQEWLNHASHLEWIITPAAGRDYFHIPASSHVDVDYCSFHGELMGETVLGMMLTHVRGIKESILLQKHHNWPIDLIWKQMRPLRGSHLVILGFGHIGRWIGKLAKPFGMRITGIKRKPATPPSYFDKNDTILTLDRLDSILPQADHLALSLPGGEDTTDIINKKRMQLLPPHAVIYNVGRGNAICETALVEALKSGDIQAAYLDVFKKEPLSLDSPLRTCKNVFIMPHASAISPNYLDLFINEFVVKYKRRYNS